MSIAYNKKVSAMTNKAIGSAMRHIGCATALVVVLAGCARQGPSEFNVAPVTYQQRHPIVVDTSPTNLDIPAGNERTHLTVGMETAIKSFGKDYRLSGAKSLQILVPAGSSNEVSASDLARQARDILEEDGVYPQQIAVRSYPAHSAEEPGHVRLTYTAVKARVASECGVWPTDVSSDFQNRNYENFGCATQSNLAAIIADPNDLIEPRGQGIINAERAAVVIGGFESNVAPPVAGVPVSDAL